MLKRRLLKLPHPARASALVGLLLCLVGLLGGGRLGDADRIGGRKRIPQSLVQFLLGATILPRSHVRIFRVLVMRGRIELVGHDELPCRTATTAQTLLRKLARQRWLPRSLCRTLQ